MRLFVAAELPPSLRRRLAVVQEGLRELPLRVRWARPEGIHLTLKFLGEAPEARLPEIGASIETVARRGVPFRLQAGRAAAFPERGAPRLLWIEVAGEIEAARGLAREIDAATALLGFASETRPFRPHLTLGRVQESGRGDWRGGLATAGPPGAEEFDVTECVLFESRLQPGGAVYTALRRCPLGASS